jgi:predicted Holliday junction resolvase-like endonuclease
MNASERTLEGQHRLAPGVDVPFWAVAGGVALPILLVWMWVASTRRLRRKVRDLDGAKRSQSTRYGQTMEQFAPFLADWPWDPKGFRFIGSPVDGIQFTPDGVVFVEVKSADSRLSPLQAEIKRQVQAGEVEWREVRFD